MHRLRLLLTLLTDVAIPAVSRTIDNPGTRRAIPGRLLLGAAAARLHADLPEADAWRVFQTDAVRFLDGLPHHAGARALPTPRALHVPKGRGLPDVVHNLATAAGRDDTHGVQVEAWSAEFVSPSLDRELTVPTETSLRTAIGFDRRAANGLLYSLDVIRAGAVFEAAVLAERPDDLDRVAAALDGVIRLGRSRSAELGRVKVTLLGRDTVAQPTTVKLDRIAYLAVGAIAFIDPATGAPTFSPTPAHFGLGDGWALDPARTFIRTERFVPFHGKRRIPDTERLVLAAGSVIAFARGDRAQTAVTPVSAVGAFLNEGLGEVLRMDGPLLTPRVPTPRSVTLGAPASGPIAPPSDELFRWASRQATQHRDALDLAERARTEAARMATWRASTSQWGVVRAMGRAARLTGLPADRFREQLRDHLKHGIASLEKAWGQRLGDKSTTGDRLLEALKDHPTPAAFAEVLAEAVVRRKKTDRKDLPDRGARA